MKNKTTASMMKEMIGIHPGISAALLFVAVGGVGFSLVPPQILRVLIDRHLLAGRMDGLWLVVITYVVVIVLIGVLDFLKGALLVVFGQKMVKRIRRELDQKVQKIGLQYFTRHSAGEITSVFTNDVDQVQVLFSEGIIGMVMDSMKIMGILISVSFFSLKLSGMVVLIVPPIFFLTRAFQKRMLRAQTKNLKELSMVNNHISESLKNRQMIQTYGKEWYMEELYGKKLKENFKTIERVNFYDSCYAPIIQLTRAMVISVVILLSADQFHVLGISLGMVAASIDFISNLFAPIEALGMELQSMQKGFSGIKGIDAFLSLEEMEPKKEQGMDRCTECSNGEAGFAFQRLSFSYEGSEKKVLDGITLSIKAGTNVTFVGRTGAGKTTLFKLIMGLEKPTEGRITWNGVDVYDMSNGEKSKLFGYVEQNFSFVEGTVAQQISLGDERISREQVEQAVEFVGLSDSIEGMAQGLDTPVQSANLFSQGQKQLLSIARAIVGNPPVLLLDEITANLDSATEEHVVRILGKAEENRTVLSISHRLTSMLHCDLIVALDDGCFVMDTSNE